MSQNFGHEEVTTTLRSYVTLDDQRIADVMLKIDFTGKRQSNDVTFTLEDMQDFVDSQKKT